MSNLLWPAAKESLLKGEIDMLTDNIKIVLVDAGTYTFSSTHQYLSDIAVAARVATSANLTTKTTTGGAFDCDDVTFTALTGATVEAFALYQDSGVAATSRLIYWCDTATGLPLTPNGSDEVLQFDNGTNKVFHL